MRENRSGYIKNLLLPCAFFSSLAGIFTATLVFIFKVVSIGVIHLSEKIYSFVRQEPIWLPALIGGAALVGVLVWLLLKNDNDCRGGGIPTAVATIRGFTPLNWVKSAFLMPISAIMTFFVGVPLGNEGPCVQMGTAIGQGTVRIFGGKRNQAWRRYVMTGGACTGFASATGAPVTGILFAVEEAHRRFSPMLFIVASISVLVGQVTTELLGTLTGFDTALFSFRVHGSYSLGFLWVPVAVGIICGIVAIFFTKAYKIFGKLIKNGLERVPFIVKILVIFVLVAVIGFFSADVIGSGHALTDVLIERGGVWYFLIICFVVRAVMMMIANNSGVTGGLFVPTLTFGAIIGSLVGMILLRVGLIDAAQYEITVVIGMVAFLAAASRTPITAVVFAAEVLCGFAYILPVAIGVAVAYVIIEMEGIAAFNDTVIESKIEAAHKGKEAIIYDVYLTVQPKSFAVEKEIRDIIWPPTCVVLGVEKNVNAGSEVGISEGDVLHVHYQSFTPHKTFEELEYLVGTQSEDVRLRVHTHGKNHQVPEI